MGVAQVEVEAGDLLVMGTDGLFDNMWEDEMLAVIAKEMQKVQASGGTAGSTAAARQLAEALASVASRNGGDSSYKSPWAVEAAQAGMVRDTSACLRPACCAHHPMVAAKPCGMC
jgi:hypothetical protein